MKPGVTDLRFDDLGYARFALESYETFKGLRDEGVIPAGVRFQVCLPGASSAIDAFFDDTSEWPMVHAAYIEGIGREIERMLEVIPAEDLVIQFDFAWEVVDLAIGDGSYFPFWPADTVDEKYARHGALIADITKVVPEDVPVGYHWCYGTWGGWPMTAMEDLALCVRLSNETVANAGRRSTTSTCPSSATRARTSSPRSTTSTSATRRSTSASSTTRTAWTATTSASRPRASTWRTSGSAPCAATGASTRPSCRSSSTSTRRARATCGLRSGRPQLGSPEGVP